MKLNYFFWSRTFSTGILIKYSLNQYCQTGVWNIITTYQLLSVRTVNSRKVLMMQQAWDSVWGDVVSMDMMSTMYSMCVSVFPNVPERPGLPCTGEDRKCFFLFDPICYRIFLSPPKKLSSYGNIIPLYISIIIMKTCWHFWSVFIPAHLGRGLWASKCCV